MNIRSVFVLVVLILSVLNSTAQPTFTVYGTVKDELNQPIDYLIVSSPQTVNDAITNESGQYQITLPARKEVQLHFRHIAYKDTVISLFGKSGEQLQINVSLMSTNEKLKTVDVYTKYEDGYTRVDPRLNFSMPSPTGGAESFIKTLPGVFSTNELTSQYNVRGGNYDENLIFVNDIQIYRPFLVRNGGQEGLSFVNLDLTQSVKFSAGGFSAQFGDKMSSVMDVEYKKPKQLGGSLMVGFLGGSAHLEGCVKNKQKNRDVFSYLVGVRYKNTALILKTMDTKAEYRPNFFDTQMLLGWNISDKFEISLLGNFSINNYKYIPQDRDTRFGTTENINMFKVYFEGQEVDKYESYLGGLTFTYRPNLNNKFRLILSSYYAKESETYDILSEYYLYEIEGNFDKEAEDIAQVVGLRAYGGSLEHARNYLKFLVSAADIRGDHQLHKKSNFSWGVKVQNERINDRLNQWLMMDSSGYTLPHIPTHPGDTVPAGDPSRDLEVAYYLNTANSLNTIRVTGFVQNQWKIDSEINPRFTLFNGLRFYYWSFNNDYNFSPRTSLLYKPRWKNEWLFWLKTGVYYQAPFYREYRDKEGTLNPNIKSQFSYHVILASEYNLRMWNRPFKLTMEAYYKYLDKLVSYYVDNLQIIYSGKNDSKGFATGFDARFSGELLEGLESWIGISFMSTMEKMYPYTDDKGELVVSTYKRRPTDQRFAFNIFFQDHIPGYRPLRVHLNFVYSTGLPFWNPQYVRTKKNTFKMSDYFRVDIGFSYIFYDQSRDRSKNKNKFAQAIKNAGVYFEVFNLLGTNNVSSYIWIKDISNNSWGVPNTLTQRMINLKFAIEF